MWLRPPCSFREALEGALSEEPLGRDIPEFNLSHARRLDPRRFGLPDWLGQLGLRAHHGIKLLPDLAGYGSRPPRADLAQLDKIIPISLAKVQSGDAGRVLDEADDGEFPLLNGFDFQPCLVPVRSVWRVRVLGDDAFPVQLGCVLEHLLPVADDVFGVDNWRFNPFEEFFQRSLALDLPRTTKVEAIQVQHVEGVEDQLVLPASGKFGLEFRKIGSAVPDDYHLAIDDRLPRQIERAGNDRETLGPIQPVTGEDLLLSLVEVNLNPVAVEFDFMQPLRPLGAPWISTWPVGV